MTLEELRVRLGHGIVIEDVSERELDWIGKHAKDCQLYTSAYCAAKYAPTWMSNARFQQIHSAINASPLLTEPELASLTEAEKPESILAEAERIVNGERAADYGDSTANLLRIASIAELLIDDSEWEVLCKQELTGTVIAKVMIAVKLARERNKHRRDNLVDLAGYAELLDRCYR